MIDMADTLPIHLIIHQNVLDAGRVVANGSDDQIDTISLMTVTNKRLIYDRHTIFDWYQSDMHCRDCISQEEFALFPFMSIQTIILPWIHF